MFTAYHVKVHDDDVDSPVIEQPPIASEVHLFRERNFINKKHLQSFESPKFEAPPPLPTNNPLTVAMTSDDLDAWLGSDDQSPKSTNTVRIFNVI